MAQNSGYDPQETLLKLQTEYEQTGQLVGADLSTGQDRSNSPLRTFHTYTGLKVLKHLIDSLTGEPMVAAEAGVWDNYSVKKQLLHSWSDCTFLYYFNFFIRPQTNVLIPLQHSHCHQHLVGGRDHASWNVFSERLKASWRSCSSYTRRNCWLPKWFCQHVLPSLSSGACQRGPRPAVKHRNISHSRKCHLSDGISFSWSCLCLPSDWFIYTIMLKALICDTQLFLPLKIFSNPRKGLF